MWRCGNGDDLEDHWRTTQKMVLLQMLDFQHIQASLTSLHAIAMVLIQEMLDNKWARLLVYVTGLVKR